MITEIGPAVDRPFAIEDAVMAIVVPSGAHGGYRADLVVSARSAAKIPAGLSDVQAATIPMNGLTARLALDALALPAGATVAVTGAAGTVGGYVVQLAKQAGLIVVADAASSSATTPRPRPSSTGSPNSQVKDGSPSAWPANCPPPEPPTRTARSNDAAFAGGSSCGSTDRSPRKRATSGLVVRTRVGPRQCGFIAASPHRGGVWPRRAGCALSPRKRVERAQGAAPQ